MGCSSDNSSLRHLDCQLTTHYVPVVALLLVLGSLFLVIYKRNQEFRNAKAWTAGACLMIIPGVYQATSILRWAINVSSNLTNESDTKEDPGLIPLMILLFLLLWIPIVAFELFTFVIWLVVLTISLDPKKPAEEAGIPLSQTAEAADGYDSGPYLEASEHQEPSAMVLPEAVEHEKAWEKGDEEIETPTTETPRTDDGAKIDYQQSTSESQESLATVVFEAAADEEAWKTEDEDADTQTMQDAKTPDEDAADPQSKASAPREPSSTVLFDVAEWGSPSDDEDEEGVNDESKIFTPSSSEDQSVKSVHESESDTEDGWAKTKSGKSTSWVSDPGPSLISSQSYGSEQNASMDNENRALISGASPQTAVPSDSLPEIVVFPATEVLSASSEERSDEERVEQERAKHEQWQQQVGQEEQREEERLERERIKKERKQEFLVQQRKRYDQIQKERTKQQQTQKKEECVVS